MEKDLFHDLYKRLDDLDLRSCPPDLLSGLLHGYLTVYSMVRVYPWLERDFGTPGDIHERAKEIARLYPERLKDEDIPVDTRSGYAADMMDVYQLYSDLWYLESGLDAAYEILSTRESGKISLPCRTPNVCRLLCDCYYFTGDEVCGELAGRLVTEVLGHIRGGDREGLRTWWQVICLYRDVIGETALSREDRERLNEELNRSQVSVEREEDEEIEQFRQASKNVNSLLVVRVFEILARRAFDDYNELYGKKE